jgi:tetratricopeptide (TPR) repeat protein
LLLSIVTLGAYKCYWYLLRAWEIRQRSPSHRPAFVLAVGNTLLWAAFLAAQLAHAWNPDWQLPLAQERVMQLASWGVSLAVAFWIRDYMAAQGQRVSWLGTFFLHHVYLEARIASMPTTSLVRRRQQWVVACCLSGTLLLVGGLIYQVSISGQTDAACDKAIELIEGDRKDEAEGVLRAAIAENPGHGMAHMILAMLLEEAKRYGEAEVEARRAIAIYEPQRPFEDATDPTRASLMLAAAYATVGAVELERYQSRSTSPGERMVAAQRSRTALEQSMTIQPSSKAEALLKQLPAGLSER